MATIAEKIYQFNAGRLPDMIQRKYALMSKNPFSFFRATSHLFYDDLITLSPLCVSVNSADNREIVKRIAI